MHIGIAKYLYSYLNIGSVVVSTYHKFLNFEKLFLFPFWHKGIEKQACLKAMFLA